MENPCLIQCQARISEVKRQLERREGDTKLERLTHNKVHGLASVSCPEVMLEKTSVTFVEVSF